MSITGTQRATHIRRIPATGTDFVYTLTMRAGGEDPANAKNIAVARKQLEDKLLNWHIKVAETSLIAESLTD